MASGKVVGGIFLAGDELFGVEELTVSATTDFVDDGGLEIDEDGARDVLAGSGFAEEGVEGVVGYTEGGVTWHHAIGLDAMFQAVEFPAGVANLDPGLTYVNADDFSHFWIPSASLSLSLSLFTLHS